MSDPLPCDICGMQGQIDLCDERGQVTTTVCYRCWGSGWMKKRVMQFQNDHHKAMNLAVRAFNQKPKKEN